MFLYIYVICYVLMCYMCGKLERGQAETGVRSICASLLLIRAVPNIFYLSKVVAILYFRLRISPENFENWFLLAASLQSRAWSAYCPYIARSHIAHCPSAQLDDQLPIGQSSRQKAWLQQIGTKRLPTRSKSSEALVVCCFGTGSFGSWLPG